LHNYLFTDNLWLERVFVLDNVRNSAVKQGDQRVDCFSNIIVNLVPLSSAKFPIAKVTSANARKVFDVLLVRSLRCLSHHPFLNGGDEQQTLS